MTFQSRRPSNWNLRWFNIVYVTTSLLIWIALWHSWFNHMGSITYHEGGANDISLLSTQKMRRKVVFSSPLFRWLQKWSPLSSQGRATLPALLYPSQASYTNKPTFYLPLCPSVNYCCAETQRTWASLIPEKSCSIPVLVQYILVLEILLLVCLMKYKFPFKIQ